MGDAAIAAAAALIAAELGLATISWRRQSVLGAVAALIGISAAAAALALGTSGGAATDALGGSLFALIVGTGVFVLGQLLERALDEEPGGGPPDSG
jgi:ABC-type thiamin/hydroxymethylpyrimidine transport system permease subunit